MLDVFERQFLDVMVQSPFNVNAKIRVESKRGKTTVVSEFEAIGHFGSGSSSDLTRKPYSENQRDAMDWLQISTLSLPEAYRKDPRKSLHGAICEISGRGRFKTVSVTGNLLWTVTLNLRPQAAERIVDPSPGIEGPSMEQR